MSPSDTMQSDIQQQQEYDCLQEDDAAEGVIAGLFEVALQPGVGLLDIAALLVHPRVHRLQLRDILG